MAKDKNIILYTFTGIVRPERANVNIPEISMPLVNAKGLSDIGTLKFKIQLSQISAVLELFTSEFDI